MNLLLDILSAVWLTARQMAPWLLFGFFAAGVLSLLVSPETVSRFLGRAAGKKAVLLAVALGVPLPLCSCGVLPVAAGLKRGGASKGAVAAFLISTPQTGIDSFFATGSLLGWCFAVVRPAVAALTGLCGGALISHLDTGPETCVSNAQPQRTPSRGILKSVQQIITYGYGTLLKNVSFALLIGLLLSALITVFIPDRFFDQSFLGNDWVAFPVMLLIGMPMYVCSTASIPVALALMAKGISPGAALIFLIVGPALNGASLAMLLQILGKKCMAIYLLVIAIASLLAGAALNIINTQWNVLPHYTAAEAGCCTQGAPLMPLIGILCAIVLFALLAWHLMIDRMLKRKRTPLAEAQPTTDTRRITVKGMRCDHCRGAVRKLLEGYPSVTQVIPTGDDTFDVRGELPPTLAADIKELGFELIDA